MYGYGGHGDKLTFKGGTLEYCYDGSQVWTSNQYGDCQGSFPSWWEWVVDDCYLASVGSGPGNVVWRTGKGDFHCNPPWMDPCASSTPDGYYHTLTDHEEALPSGWSRCVAQYDGHIVAGIGTVIVSNCDEVYVE